MEKVTISTDRSIRDYELESSLSHEISQLKTLIESCVDKIGDQTIWMINSTSQGGGVAEMLPGQISIQRELGLKVEWLVMETDDSRFFDFTKQTHNAIHGKGDPSVFEDAENRSVYDAVNQANTDSAIEFIKDGDIVVVHDPQPAGMGALIAQKRDVKLVWRCHIGLESDNELTKAVWEFLQPYLEAYDRYVFSIEEYVPSYLNMNNVDIIPPAIDPLSHKNRILSVHEVIGILHQAGVVDHKEELVHPVFEHQVVRVQPDGEPGPALSPSELQLPYRPVFTQISRWDHLKGFSPLMKAFVKLKEKGLTLDPDSYTGRWIRSSRLVLGGPDLNAVHDDPEGLEVLKSLIKEYTSFPEQFKKDIAILLLPMDSLEENSLIVNALQSVSNIVVQNSLQEGFGLTATEAMWKRVPMLISNATGLRKQVTDGVEGRMNPEPENAEMLMKVMFEMIEHPDTRELMGRRGKYKVVSYFNVISQLKLWAECWMKL